MTVDPLSHAGGGDDSSRQDLATGYPSEGVLLAATTKADLNRASEGVGVDGAGAVAVLGIDGEHGSFALVDVISLQGQQRAMGAAGATLQTVCLWAG